MRVTKNSEYKPAAYRAKAIHWLSIMINILLLVSRTSRHFERIQVSKLTVAGAFALLSFRSVEAPRYILVIGQKSTEPCRGSVCKAIATFDQEEAMIGR
jgi:Na+/H+ antiporter NhaD/arsenite permease-like protein